MEQHHIIETALIDISYVSEEEAFEANGGIDTFVKESLLPVVEDVFNEIFLPDTIIRIDQLVVDLGHVPHRSYQDELPRRLRQCLREMLREHMDVRNSRPAFSYDSFKAEQVELDTIEHFLRYGYLPWYAPVNSRLNLDQLVINLIRSNERGVVNILKNGVGKSCIVERLVRQFDTEIFNKVVSLLTPLHKNLLFSLTHDLDARSAEYNLWHHTNQSCEVRVTLLKKLLETEGVSFDPLTLWTSSLEESLPSNMSNPQLMAVVNVKQVSTQQIECWRLLLARSFCIGEPQYIEQIWSLLIRDYPTMVEDALRKNLHNAHRIIQLSSAFPEQKLRDVITVLEPTEHHFIIDLISSTQLYYGKEWRVSKLGVEKERNKLWQFTMSYLLIERGGRFNKKAYLASLVRQMAAHENSTPDILLLSFRSVLESVDVSSDLMRELLELLNELDAEQSSSIWEQHPAAVPPAASNKNLSQYDWLNDDVDVRVWLTNELMSAVTTRIELLWPLLVKEYAHVLQECFSHCGQYVRIRRIMAFSFTLSMLKDLCGLLESDTWALAMIDSLRHHTRSFQLVHDDESLDKSERTFYEFTLTYLLVERGSEFNKKVYLQSLLQKMAAHNNIRYEEVLSSMAATVEISDVSSELKVGILQVLYNFRGQINEVPEGSEQLHCPDKEKDYMAGKYDDFGNVVPGAQGMEVNEREMRVEPRENQGGGQLSYAAGKEKVTKDRVKLDKSSAKLHVEHDGYQECTEQIYIQNAGLVLISPYLPRLFDRLALTVKDKFIDRNSAERAIHLLQYLAHGQVNSPEFQLVLNKILCGVFTGKPILKTILIRREEENVIEGMLQAVIKNWPAIGNTTIDGLRESFFQREGRLVLKDNAWNLLVEHRAFDMLLDRLPWSYATIRHPWMERAIFVEWR